MYNTSDELTKFHDQKVRLPNATQDKLRGHRKANQDRLKKGLEKAENPSPTDFVKQGSYAMYTINQHPNNDYDIDDGAIFLKDDLVGSRGAEMNALQTRQMVRDAVDDGSFKTPPELKKNCIRVHYKEGHHVDIPVYRQIEDENGETVLELASSDWKRSDPRGVTNWYNSAVKEKSPDNTNGQQMRRITRLTKAFSNSRDSWNSPSGFIISVLVDEQYRAYEGRGDVALYETMRAIYNRLRSDLTIKHPILDEYLTKSEEDACMIQFRDHLAEALDNLQDLLDEGNCTHKAAMKAWKKVFNNDFFTDLIADENRSAAGGLAISASEPTAPVRKRGGGRFG